MTDTAPPAADALELNQFHDSAGNVWTIRVNAWLVREFKDQHKFDIRKIGDAEVLSWLTESPEAPLIDLIALALKDQLNARHVTANDLFKSLEGDQIESATWAFINGCILFFPSAARAPLLAWSKKIQQASNQFSCLMTRKVENAQITDEMTAEIIDKAFQTASPTNTPATTQR